jgi:hypothetical protein
MIGETAQFDLHFGWKGHHGKGKRAILHGAEQK